jgi:tetratricopeptide (TPR) repeat protein
MTETIDLIDEQGNRVQVPRSEYATQMMTFARQNWENLEALRNLQMQLVQAGLFAEAYELANRNCELSNENVNDLYWRAASLAEMGQLDEAATAFAELQDDAAFAHDQSRAAVGLARVKAKQGNPQEAEELLEWAIETDPKNPGPLHSIYNYWSEQGTPESGIARLQKISDEQPQNAAPHRVLAHIALQSEDKDAVREHAHKAIERASSQDEIDETVAEMSWMLGSAGFPADIIQVVEPRRLTLRNAQSFLNLIQAYIDVDRKSDARALLQQLIDGAPPQMRTMLETRLKQIS